MKILRSSLILAILSTALPGIASAQAPGVSSGFGAYSIVQTRNIFDPDRIPFVANYAPPRPRRVEQPRRYVDSIALTGIMLNGGKALAFFFGSQMEDDKVLGVNGEIGGAKVTKITPTDVELNKDGKALTLRIGQALSVDSSTPGISLAPASTSVPADSDTAAPSSQSTSPTTTQPPGNLSDVMRRMMERREQEQKEIQ
jgi:type II secretory pathway component PulC